MPKQYDITILKLIQLILNLSDNQRKALLKKAQQLFMRGARSPRISCQIPVKYSTFYRCYSDTILNISQSGAFVQTHRPLFIGEDIEMCFKIENTSDFIEIKGEVIHASDKGIGVVFNYINPKVAYNIKKFINKI